MCDCPCHRDITEEGLEIQHECQDCDFILVPIEPNQSSSSNVERAARRLP